MAGSDGENKIQITCMHMIKKSWAMPKATFNYQVKILL